MFLRFSQLRGLLRQVIADKEEQGHVITGLLDELAALPDSYDALHAFAQRVAQLPLRQDWPYVEPDDREGIWAECDPARPLEALKEVDIAECAQRVEAAFLGSICGCMLGKPLEFNPTLDELKEALIESGEWPLKGYISDRALAALGKRHPSWTVTTRGRITFVASDDDINYTVLGMLLLEKHGLNLNKQHIQAAWLRYLPPNRTFGPERTLLVKAALNTLEDPQDDFEEWVTVLNPHDERCGAMIRADAYGYACPGRPALAAEFAWRDASWTHRRTGIYGTMFIAAALATAQVTKDRLAIFDTALKFVPRRSRFYKIVSDSLNEVVQAKDWLDGYYRIHDKYKEYSHCRVYQETGTLINTLRFAENVGDGICKQVSQGNDTDSYGATAGSLLGAFFGPGHLEARWLVPFNDDIRVTLAGFPERSLSALAKRMGMLPQRLAEND